MNLKRRTKFFILMILGLLALAISTQSITINNLGMIVVVNNTNLAPDAGAPHPFGTGERIQNITYYANNSPIQLMVYAHADTNGQHLALNLSINDTITESIHLRPLAAAENTHAFVTAIIPQYANYSVNITNYHHYEWREYPILTGNVSTNITSVSGGGSGPGCVGNCSYDGIWVNSIRKNDTLDSYGDYINLSAPFMKKSVTNPTNVIMTFNDGEFYTAKVTNTSSSNFSQIFMNPESIQMTVTDGITNQFNIFQNYSNYIVEGTTYNYNKTHFDMGGANITNLNNQTMTGILNMSGNNINQIANVTIINNTGTNPSFINMTTTVQTNSDLFSAFELWNNENRSVQITYAGVQRWWMYNASGSPKGLIGYAFPNEGIGLTFRNGSLSNRSDIYFDMFRDGSLCIGVGTGTTAPACDLKVNQNGNVLISTVGAGLRVTEGTNAKQGTCTMVGGNCVVANTAITANSRLFYNYQAPCSTNIGTLYEISRNASVNFTLRNTNAANTCVIAYEIFEPS